MTRPLDDLRVLDLSDRLSGAFAARLFGDFGADVLMVEPPEGHPLRQEPPFLDDTPGVERSVMHAYANWNKRSAVVADAAELGALVADADVVVTSNARRGAVVEGALQRLAPAAVHLSVTPHGLTGPLAERPGNNLTASARTGWAYINGYRDEPPLQMPLCQSGYIGGVAGFVAAAAALRRRELGDEAELVDVSEVEAFALTVHPWGIAVIYEGTGFSHGPAGGRLRGEPGPLYETRDGKLSLGFGDFHNWPQAMEVLRLPEIGAREDLIPDVGRHSHDLSAVVAGAARTLSELGRWDVFHAMARLRCITGVLQDIDDIVNDPQLAAREFLVETTVEDRALRAAGPVARLSPSGWRLDRPAPRLDGDEASWRERPTEPARPARTSTPPSDARSLAEGPLAGVSVFSFGQAWSGTFGTELFSLLGADVVQLGAVHRIDVWRRVGGRVPAALVDPSRTQHAANTQGLYNSVNLNKRELTLDLRTERGMELLWELLPRFDIIADNFRPTVLPRWGITLDALHARRPGAIIASISGYGAIGPYREYPANGATTEPMSGLSSLHGYEGDTGMNTGGLYPDPVAGYFLAATTLAALHHRDRTGEPQQIDVAMMEAVTTVCGDAILEYDATGRLPRPRGNHHPRIAPHNSYPALGGEWLSLATESEAAWQAFGAHLRDTRLLDGRFATMADRKANEAALDAIVGAWVAEQDAVEAEAALASIGVAAARVVPLYELYSRPRPGADRGRVHLEDRPPRDGTDVAAGPAMAILRRALGAAAALAVGGTAQPRGTGRGARRD